VSARNLSLFVFFDLYCVYVCIFVIYIEFFPYCLFVSNGPVIGCEDRLQNDLYCVGWGVKLYSIQPVSQGSMLSIINCSGCLCVHVTDSDSVGEHVVADHMPSLAEL